MSTLNFPAMHTVQLFSKNGLVKVVGVMNKDIQNKLISYISDMDGWMEQDWFYFVEDKVLLDAVNKAKELDPKAEVYKAEYEIGKKVDLTESFVTLYCVPGKMHKLTAMRKEYQKIELDHYIEDQLVNGIRVGEGDWYRVDNINFIDLIIEFTHNPKVMGATYNLVNE